MNEIEFLPADYVCVQTARTNNNWLRLLFVAVLALMGVGWAAQKHSIRELTARRDRMRQQADAVLAQLETGDNLTAELQQVDNSWRLLSGLRCHVPPTRWLTAIVHSLPARSCLLEIHSEVDEGHESAPVANAPNRPKEPPRDPVHSDLERLQKITARRALQISVRGSAADDLEVSQFLMALNDSGLFEEVQLLFTDQQTEGDRILRTFAVRLRTRSLSGKPVRTGSAPVAGHPASVH